MIPVLILAHNCVEQTKRCVESVLKQDIPTSVVLFDSGSTDETLKWAQNELPEGSPIIHVPENLGVSFGWNMGLNLLFKNEENERVLSLNNDTVLPSWFLSSLLSYDVPFITGVSVGTMEEIARQEPRKVLGTSPDFSAWLITRECWQKVGEFDESMVLYASDLDFAIRAHRAGIQLFNSGVGFYHERSSTLNSASPKERRTIEMRADADRLAFREKHGFDVWSPEYAAQFTPETFGADACKSARLSS